MSATDYILDSLGTAKDWLIDGLEETAELLVGEAENAINYGETDPMEQMRGSALIGSAAFGATFITGGATLAIVGAAILTFLWGLARWMWGLGRATRDR